MLVHFMVQNDYPIPRMIRCKGKLPQGRKVCMKRYKYNKLTSFCIISVSTFKQSYTALSSLAKMIRIHLFFGKF